MQACLSRSAGFVSRRWQQVPKLALAHTARLLSTSDFDAGLQALLGGVPGAVDEQSSPAAAKEKSVDLLVIGGGSGGLAAARVAAELGASVALADAVPPSPRGSTWGLGGTCVNVGCIPKKLMHHAALLGETVRDAGAFGWDVPPSVQHNWEALRGAVSDVRKSSNFMYQSAMWSAGVNYVNDWAQFAPDGHVQVGSRQVQAEHVLLAPGTRPSSLFGSQQQPLDAKVVTSDDIFTLPEFPSRVVIVGAGYVALECAGFLLGLGAQVTVLVRGQILRGFDRDFASKVHSDLVERGAAFHVGVVDDILDADGGGVVVRTSEGEKLPASAVLNATGRSAQTLGMGLHFRGYDAAALEADRGFVRVDEGGLCEVQGTAGVFAVGDAVLSNPQLTPFAIKEGEMLSRRLFGGATATLSRSAVPTAIFTPTEYACVGLSEEEARERHPQVEVYHTNMTPTEWAPPALNKPKNKCSAKVIVVPSPGSGALPGDGWAAEHPPSHQQVVGVHFFGPHAGEVMQGFGVALNTGHLTLETLQQSTGIHPTLAEEFVNLFVTKSSGVSPDKQLCCG